MVVDKRTFWEKQSNWQRGLLIGIFFLFAGIIYFAVDAYHYDGSCVSYDFSGPVFKEKKTKCTFFEYLDQNYWPEVADLGKTLIEEFWKTILLVVLTPVLIGFGTDLYRWGGATK